MARYEFKFVVSDVKLSDEHQQKVSQAVAQAGALALAELAPRTAVAVEFGPNEWWYGIPAIELAEALQALAVEKAGERAAGSVAG